MQRNPIEGDRNPRKTGERDASQAIGGQPRTDDEDDELQQPENVPSFLTARELRAKAPRGDDREDTGGDRHAAASFSGSKGEPQTSDDEPPRGDRGKADNRSKRK